jgi:hypothetical protein
MKDKRQRGRPPKPVWVNGICHVSIHDALLTTGGTEGGLYKALNRKQTYLGFKVCYDPKEEIRVQKFIYAEARHEPLLYNPITNLKP